MNVSRIALLTAFLAVAPLTCMEPNKDAAPPIKTTITQHVGNFFTARKNNGLAFLDLLASPLRWIITDREILKETWVGKNATNINRAVVLVVLAGTTYKLSQMYYAAQEVDTDDEDEIIFVDEEYTE